MNDFSNKKLLASSRKICLAKVGVQQLIRTEAVGGNIQRGTTDKNLVIERVEYTDSLRIARPLRRVDVTPSTGEYFYNQDTGLFETYIEYSGLQYSPRITHYLFLASEDLYTGKDPLVPDTDIVLWKGLMTNIPSTDTDLSNSLSGVNTSNVSSLELLNKDMSNYLHKDVSFNDAGIGIYMAIDGLSDVRQVFYGQCGNVDVNPQTITIEVADKDDRLEQLAHFETSVELGYMNVEERENPIPFIFGNVSCSRPEQYLTLRQGLVDPYDLDVTNLHKAYCETANELGPTANRVWRCCRLDGFKDLAFTVSAVQDFTHSNGITYTRLTVDSTAYYKIELGDTFSNGTTVMIRIAFKHVGSPLTEKYLYCKKAEYGASATAGMTFQTNPLPTVILTGGDVDKPLYLAYGRHYTANVSGIANGIKLVSIIFKDNFEQYAEVAAFFASDQKCLDFEKHTVHYRVRPDDSLHQHGTIIKRLLESAGITVNEASITAANAECTSKLVFSIPAAGETAYDTYGNYIHKILTSTIGSIVLNHQGEMEYRLLKYSDSEEIRTSVDIKENTFTYKNDYKDMLESYRYLSENELSNYTRYFSPVAHLYKITATSIRETTHLLADPHQRALVRNALLFMPRRTYTFTTKNVDLDALIYDHIKIIDNGLPDGESEKVVIVLGLAKSESDVTITGIELIGEYPWQVQ